MQVFKIIDKSILFFSLGLIVALSCLSILFYQLAAELINAPEKLTLLRQQLIVSTLIITLTSSFIYALYKYKQSYIFTGECSVITKKKLDNKRLKVLSVDDNKANLLIIKNHLTGQNIQLFSASNGKEALTIFQKQAIDIIFMDLEMADMDGIDTTQAIRLLEKNHPKKSRTEKKPRVPIIAVSAHSEEEKKLSVLAANLDDYLEKPVQKDQLYTTITRWKQGSLSDSTEKELPATTKTTSNTDSKKLDKDNSENNIPPIPSYKVVDTQLSLEHSNNNAQLAKDMLELLIQMLRTEKSVLIDHHNNQNWDDLYNLNHKLYGGSSYCGVPQLQQSNQQLEHLLKQKVSDDSIELQQIDDTIKQLLHAIDDILQWDDEHDIGIILGLDE